MVRTTVSAATVEVADTGALAVQLADNTGTLLTATTGVPTASLVQRSIIQSVGARTTGGQSAAYNSGSYREATFFLNVSAASGTGPQLNVFIDASDDGGTTWYQLCQLGPANISAAQSSPIPGTYTAPLGKGSANGLVPEFVRVRWTISGTTPSFTFGVRAVFKG
jgi:hypothetical protein